MDKISLLGMTFFGHHGVSPEEQKVGQRFMVDLEIFADLGDAGKMDDLSKSVDYVQAFELTKKIMEGEPCQLIEALAWRICDCMLSKFSLVKSVKVRVKKPHVPISGSLEGSQVEMMRAREQNH